MKCSEHRLRICKMKEECGELVKPGSDEHFHITVESCSQRRYYILNADNCFCVELDRLCNETYCVYEEDMCGQEVTYIVDGEECEECCVDFCRQSCHHITIVNHMRPPLRCGSLTLCKRVFDACGQEECHPCESFMVHVVGERFSTNVVLGPGNEYCAFIEDIPYGEYMVSEEDSEDFDVTYVVEGVESEDGHICIDQATNAMEIRNRRNDGMHVLRICKWKRVDGRLVKPHYDEHFDIVVDDGYACREYTLSCQNHFCVCIEGNKNDTFTLKEWDATNVEYELDGETVECVVVVMDEDHDVRVINVDEDECGTLVIKAWMCDEGRLFIPSQESVFNICVQGYSEDVYTLTKANDFTLILKDVKVDYYHVLEESTRGCLVSYEVDGIPQEDGYVQVQSGQESFVNVLNQTCPPPIEGGNIHIVKRVDVPCNNDDIQPPNEGVFEIYIEGPQGGDYYILDANKNYEMNYPATNGWYTIYEVNPISSVTYRLDGVDIHNEVHFLVEDTNHEVIVINHINKINYVL